MNGLDADVDDEVELDDDVDCVLVDARAARIAADDKLPGCCCCWRK